jgi:hypothetical protein
MWCRRRTCVEAAVGLALIASLAPLAWRLLPPPPSHHLQETPVEMQSEEGVVPDGATVRPRPEEPEPMVAEPLT